MCCMALTLLFLRSFNLGIFRLRYNVNFFLDFDIRSLA